LKNDNYVEAREQHQINISNRFLAFENLNHNVDISRASERIRENIKNLAKKSLRNYEFTQPKL
jgi:hypothetical protein